MSSSRFSRWWQNSPAKAEEIKRRRRERYNKDPEKERERKRLAYAKIKKQSDKKNLPRPRIVWIKDDPIQVWSVGVTASFLNIHKRTLTSLESKGSIPINRSVDDNGRRWWPELYVKWLQPYFILRQSGRLTAQEFSNRVWNDWKAELKTGKIPVLYEDSNGQGEDDRSSNSR